SPALGPASLDPTTRNISVAAVWPPPQDRGPGYRDGRAIAAVVGDVHLERRLVALPVIRARRLAVARVPRQVQLGQRIAGVTESDPAGRVGDEWAQRLVCHVDFFAAEQQELVRMHPVEGIV